MTNERAWQKKHHLYMEEYRMTRWHTSEKDVICIHFFRFLETNGIWGKWGKECSTWMVAGCIPLDLLGRYKHRIKQRNVERRNKVLLIRNTGPNQYVEEEHKNGIKTNLFKLKSVGKYPSYINNKFLWNSFWIYWIYLWFPFKWHSYALF